MGVNDRPDRAGLLMSNLHRRISSQCQTVATRCIATRSIATKSITINSLPFNNPRGNPSTARHAAIESKRHNACPLLRFERELTHTASTNCP
jgi:hypothetical protein